MARELAREKAAHKNAIVTGSSNGIGEAIVKELAKLDYRLVVTGRLEADIRRVAEDCRKLSPSKLKPLEVKADLEREEEVEGLFRQAMAFFADGSLHLLVNNAGYGFRVPANLPDECYRNFKKMMAVNLNAVVRLTLLAARPLAETARALGEPASVVNIGSIAGVRPSVTLFGYGTSKAAVNMFTECMAVELAPDVRVNCVSPGPVETKIFERSGMGEFTKQLESFSPLRRTGRPEEVARAVLYLADNRSSAFITGANLRMDGGLSLAVAEAPGSD